MPAVPRTFVFCRARTDPVMPNRFRAQNDWHIALCATLYSSRSLFNDCNDNCDRVRLDRNWTAIRGPWRATRSRRSSVDTCPPEEALHVSIQSTRAGLSFSERDLHQNSDMLGVVKPVLRLDLWCNLLWPVQQDFGLDERRLRLCREQPYIQLCALGGLKKCTAEKFRPSPQCFRGC